jgi:hypothetical protein
MSLSLNTQMVLILPFSKLVLFCFFAVLGMELRGLCMLGKSLPLSYILIPLNVFNSNNAICDSQVRQKGVSFTSHLSHLAS